MAIKCFVKRHIFALVPNNTGYIIMKGVSNRTFFNFEMGVALKIFKHHFSFLHSALPRTTFKSPRKSPPVGHGRPLLGSHKSVPRQQKLGPLSEHPK